MPPSHIIINLMKYVCCSARGYGFRSPKSELDTIDQFRQGTSKITLIMHASISFITLFFIIYFFNLLTQIKCILTIINYFTLWSVHVSKKTINDCYNLLRCKSCNHQKCTYVTLKLPIFSNNLS